MVALGRSCQVSYQIRRYTGQDSASYFDWLGVPFEGLLYTLRQRMQGCFERADLERAANGTTIMHKQTGISFRHLFSRLEGSELIDLEALDREYPAKAAKMQAMAARWFEVFAAERPLFVRHDALTREQAHLLYEELALHAEGRHFELLIVLPPGEAWQSGHPFIHGESGVPPSTGPCDWKGDSRLWEQVLARYWVRDEVEYPQREAASDTPLITFQVPNEVGLGHMNRMACVALAVRELDPAVRILFVVEGSSHGLLESMHLPYIALPAAAAMRRSASWRSWESGEKSEIAHSVARSIVDSTRPDLVVYDCFPSLAFVRAASRRGIPSILCMRKMKDYDAYAAEARVQLVLGSCRAILVPHSEEEAPLPEDLHRRALYVGAILKPLPSNPTPVHTRLKLPGRRVILVSAGGGGHPDTSGFLRLVIDALELLRQRRDDFVTLLIPGPLFQQWGELDIPAGTRILPFDPKFVESCATSDLVISQAGYNSANELAFLGTPTLLIPATRGFDDQFERAHAFAASRSQMRALEAPRPETIAEAAGELLDGATMRVRETPPEGAYLAAAHLLHTLGRL